MLLILEGLNDAEFLTRISRVLARGDPRLPDLNRLIAAGDVVVLPFCGGSPLPWTHRLSSLCCPELHIYDREREPETELRRRAASEVNRRPGCRAFLTRFRSLENYLSPVAIQNAGGPWLQFSGGDCVATRLAIVWHAQDASRAPWASLEKSIRLKKTQRAKRWLNIHAVEHMSADLLREADEDADIERWLLTIVQMLGSPEAQAPPAADPNHLVPRAP